MSDNILNNLVTYSSLNLQKSNLIKLGDEFFLFHLKLRENQFPQE